MRLTYKDENGIYQLDDDYVWEKGIDINGLDDITDYIGEREDLEEQLGCPLEKMIEELKENYLMLKEHIKIKEDYKDKHYEESRKMNVMEQFYQNGRFDEDLSISKEIKCRLENKYPMLKADRSE